MDRTSLGTMTEVVALRAILATWIMASLAQNKDRIGIIGAMEDQTQHEIRALTFTNLSPDQIEVLRETASLHASQFYGKISAAFRSAQTP
jgi:DNA-binding transcriptional regulator YiaG